MGVVLLALAGVCAAAGRRGVLPLSGGFVLLLPATPINSGCRRRRHGIRAASDDGEFMLLVAVGMCDAGVGGFCCVAGDGEVFVLPAWATAWGGMSRGPRGAGSYARSTETVCCNTAMQGFTGR